MWVPSLDWVDPREEEMATHSSILAGRIPWTEEPDVLQSTGSQSRTWLSIWALRDPYCCCSVTKLRPAPCDPMDYGTPGLLPFTISRSLLKFMSIELVMPSNHFILCFPLLLQPSIFPSIRIFSSESVLRMRWPKYWSFSFSIIPSKEIPGLISFRMDWLDLPAVQGTLKSLLQNHS